MPVNTCLLNVFFPTNDMEAFEQFAASHGIKIKAYRATKGIMACQEFLNHINTYQQTITYCGMNAHGQNGIAEQAIQSLCDRAHTIPIRAIEKRPEAVTMVLWPFALKMAASIHNGNGTPGQSGLSPEEIFTRQKAQPDRLLDVHTFGYLVFVLDPKLQQGQKILKWQPRS